MTVDTYGVRPKDAGAFDSVFTDDVVFINPATSVFLNWDELHAYHLAALRNSQDAEAHYEILAVRLPVDMRSSMSSRRCGHLISR
ncbi:hypothetical protein ACFWPX_05090 [Nocardia sp. NPDC058518]|uniref:hypothetical protein n=1 Tax=Nocardia sp. NPDC058518 TaxID=3346534 RepID=UPI00366539E8